jgi:hypothetical protein
MEITMTDITYDKIAAAAPAPVSTPKAGKKSWWQHAFDAMVEARMRQAERIVKEYQDLAKR